MSRKMFMPATTVEQHGSPTMSDLFALVARRFSLGALAAFFLASPAMAHPDYWVTVKYQLTFSETAVTEMTIDWEFDVFYSSEAIETYDLDGDMAFSEDEAQALQAALFAPLAFENYFVKVYQGGLAKPMRLETASPRIDGDRLAISFTLLPETPLLFREAPLAFATYDEKAYDFSLAETEFLTVGGPYDSECRFRIGDGTGPLDGVPQTVSLLCPK